VAKVAARGCPVVAVSGLFWHGEEEGGRRGRVGQKAEWAGWLLGRLGRKLKKSFRNKNWIFEFTKALEICKGDLGRILTQGFFPKFF
jgi:hypothetical protein